MNIPSYHFPLSIQTVLPEHYREDKAFHHHLSTLQQLGLYGVELNMADPQKVDIADVQDFLSTFELKLTMFASGLTAKTFQLSLSSPDPEVRQRSVSKCRDIIDVVEGADAGIILGFMKGPAAPDVHEARARFVESLRAISPYAADKQVPILVEATNRYESAVANSLADTVELIQEFDNPFIRILPDTFHMNIEEADALAALAQYASYYDSLHISDNNRFFPGFGAIRFEEYVQFLKDHEYQGGVAIEGNIKESFVDDVTASAEYLRPFLT
ncbi:TIM barrel protein [candidate division KSB3 bacterium]|uniref:TIM barrel protein n=1 Tax=candidate division KSB3 bacterium TaxID=2044937 RepID=A0A9D5Q6S2_9BACT|nr:TIM barrel protein [candidate division KSB3 bacterium]MBD3326159.1 TIM barrel protein [candidate division KSB3 bacterium]